MDLASFKFLSDENIHAELVLFIRELGFDIEDVITKGLQGKSDIEVLNHATENNRIVITQDSDFGRLAYTTDIDFKGIIYLRPGHISGSYHKETFKCILKESLTLHVPFILVAERGEDIIKIRLRNNFRM